jgi:hypothetical protein
MSRPGSLCQICDIHYHNWSNFALRTLIYWCRVCSKKCKCFSECFCALIWNYLFVDDVQKGLFPNTHARAPAFANYSNVISHTTVPYTFPLFLSLGADGRRESDLRLCRGKLIGRFLLIRRQQFQIAEQHLFRCVRCTTGREKRATVKPNRVQFTRFFVFYSLGKSKRKTQECREESIFCCAVQLQRESHFVTEDKLSAESSLRTSLVVFLLRILQSFHFTRNKLLKQWYFVSSVDKKKLHQ